MVTPVHSNTSVVRGCLSSQEELSGLLHAAPGQVRLDGSALRKFCARLHAELLALRTELTEAARVETAFIASDCEELVDSSLEHVRGFPDHFAALQDAHSPLIRYGERRIELADVPWGTVAVILPQSAFLYLAVTCMLNALAVGNRVILRAPGQSVRSAALLAEALDASYPPPGSVSIVLASGRAFVEAVCDSREPILLHYLGGSSHAPEIVSACFRAGKQVIVDGEGNAWVWVDRDVSPDLACDLLTSGALRYNGQTCTSVNGAVIHPGIYAEVRERLIQRWNSVTYGDPTRPGIQVGPLMSEEQADQCLARMHASGAEILVGGRHDGSLLSPTLVAEPAADSELISHGFFACALWIVPGDLDSFARLWLRNRYPLCAGVLSGTTDPAPYLRALPGVARLVLNGDPSIEYLYEPWGGYPASGTNPVSHWHTKYLRTVQLDHPA